MYIIKLNSDTKNLSLKVVKPVLKLSQTGRKGEKGDPGDPASNLVTSVNGKQGVVVIDKSDVGLSNVPNLDTTTAVADAHTHLNKPILDATTSSFTTAQATKLSGIEALAEVNNISDSNATDLTDGGDSSLHFHSTDRNRANHTGTQSADTVVDGTTNKVYTNTDKSKLAGIAAGAEVNVNADWNSVSGDSQILNKPSIPGTIVESIVAGTNVTVDDTDPSNPIVSASGSGGGAVDSVNSQTGIVVLDTDDIADTATNRYTNDSDITRLATTSGTNTGDQDLSGLVPNTRTVNGHALSANVTVTKSDVGLGNVDNTSDSSKPISDDTQDALDAKANTADLATVATTGDYADLINKPSIPSAYTDEMAQDAVGGILTDSSEIDLNYNDATPSISASLVAGSIDETKLDTSVNASLDLADSAVQDLSDLGITASAAELNFVDGVTSSVQTQLDGKQPLDSDLTTIAGLTPTTDNFMVAASSAWASRTPAQAKTSLALVKGDVGLGNVDNTSDSTKNSAVATLTNKSIDLASNTLTGTTAQFNTALSDNDFATLAGTETLTSKTVTSPKINEVLDTNGNKVLSYTTTASAVNYLDVMNNSTTLTPRIQALGTDSNISINMLPKGTGNLTVNGTPAVTTSGTFTLSNKTLTAPKFVSGGFIADNNGNEEIIFTTTTSAVNEITLANAATANNPTITASGGDTNVGINLVPKGSGTIQVSGVPIVTTTATQTLTNKTLTSPIISSISNTGTLTLPTSTDTLVGRATTDTLTNKRITKRVVTVNTPGATPSTNVDNGDIFEFTGLDVAITSMTTNLTGTPVNGQMIEFIFVDNATARAITWGASFANGGLVNLPTTTVISTALRVLVQYQTIASLNKWVCVAVS